MDKLIKASNLKLVIEALALLIDNNADVAQAEIQAATELMQPKLTAGTGITISEDNVISATGGGGGSSEAVKYTAQTLTTTQQEQACANIGALMQKDVLQNVQDNSKPISAAAVYTTVGNINALLESI